MISKKMFIASDHRGYNLKQKILGKYQNAIDCGPHNAINPVDYPDYAKLVVKHIQQDTKSFGVLICNSGIGMTIAANKFDGIRAVWCDKPELAILAREHNNANIVCFGSKFVLIETAIKCIKAFMDTLFATGRHEKRVEKLFLCNQ
jgi:ribose 5-phosphate isomerase B